MPAYSLEIDIEEINLMKETIREGIEESGGFFDPLGALEVTKHNLSHWHQTNVSVFITWRLADALADNVLERIRSERNSWLASHPKPWTQTDAIQHSVLFSSRIDQILDAGAGDCILRDSRASHIVSQAIKHFDGERYDVNSCVVMPNHVHALLRLTEVGLLPKIVHSWKSYTAKQLAPFASDRTRVWQADYWDRLVRSPRHLQFCRQYILENPGRAQLNECEFQLWSKPDSL